MSHKRYILIVDDNDDDVEKYEEYEVPDNISLSFSTGSSSSEDPDSKEDSSDDDYQEEDE